MISKEEIMELFGDCPQCQNKNSLYFFGYTANGEVYASCSKCSCSSFLFVPGYEVFDEDSCCPRCRSLEIETGQDSSGMVLSCDDCGYATAKPHLEVDV